MKGRNTYILSARVPDEVYLRVKELAKKREMTMSDWIGNLIRTRLASKYRRKTDWICSYCGHINDVYARTCSSCMEKRQGNERRL